MSVSISGILLDPFGQPASFAEVKFITWQGANDVLTTAPAVFKTSADGAYSFAVELGTFTVQVRYNQSNGKFQTIKQKVIVNSNVTATTLGELLLFNEPLTPPEIAYVEQLTAECEGYRDESALSAAEAAASVNMINGVLVFQTFAILDAYTPTTSQEGGSFKVVNDPTPSNNGYYAWVSGTTYIKDADAVVGVIEEGNTFDAVSGSAVYDFNLSERFNFKSDSVINTTAKEQMVKAVIDYGITITKSGYSDFYLQDCFANHPLNPDLYQFRIFAFNGVSNVKVAEYSETTPGKDISEPEEINLIEEGSSGVTARIIVDWLKIDGLRFNSSNTNVDENTFKMVDEKVGQKFPEVTSPPIAGQIIDFTVNGIDARLTTSNNYDDENHKDYLMILCHGNTKDHTYKPNAAMIAYCAANGISYACIDGQDESIPTFTTDKLGWGNYSHVNRTVQLYGHLMENYSFQTNVIIVGDSMGGLVMGHLAYSRQIPISFCIGIGPVPDLSYIFTASATVGTDRRPAIRAAYGMAQDGSDDSQLETFIQGYDWYDMGLIDVSGAEYKVGYNSTYLYLGTADSTSVQFGGIAKYNEIRDAIRNAGGVCNTTELPSLSHDNDAIWSTVVVDDVIGRELGIGN